MRAIAAPVAFAALVSLSVPAQVPCPSATTVDDFENRRNSAGWSFNVTVRETIEPTGGRPGAWLRNRGVDSFAPILTNDRKAGGLWVGDFRAQGVERISLDARTDGRGFGQPRGFFMSLLLRDTKGTPTPVDDDYAYSVGPNVPLIGQGWVHYDFDVPSASIAAVPKGWVGGHAGNLTAFRPGVTWSDVIQNVDSVEFWWHDPSFFAIITPWDVGADNITMERNGQAFARPLDGSGVNPQILSTTPPRFSAPWDMQLDCTAFGPGSAVLLISAPTTIPSRTPFGELFINPTAASLLAFQGAGSTPAQFNFFLPDLPALCGLSFTLQGLCAAGPRSGGVSNAFLMYPGH